MTERVRELIDDTHLILNGIEDISSLMAECNDTGAAALMILARDINRNLEELWKLEGGK